MPCSKERFARWLSYSGKFDEDERIIESSLHLHCLECNHPHTIDQWQEMNERGDYVAERVGLTTESCQFGGLAGFRSRTWLGIAKARRKLKHNNTYVQQLSFDNNHRGLPHQKRSKITTDKLVQTALKHRALEKPYAEDIAIVLISANTQFTSSNGINPSSATTGSYSQAASYIDKL